MNPRLIPYRQTKCVEIYQHIHCSRNITIRDYIPRRFAFSVGYECLNKNIFSVQGLEFKFIITKQSNTTDCTRTNNIFAGICENNYDYTTLGNLVGMDFDMLKQISRHATILDPLLNETLLSCYQNAVDVLCSVFIPKCDPFNNIVVHPCRETCQDFIKACDDHVLNILKQRKTEWFQRALQICLTSLRHAKPKDKMEFPTLFPHYA